MPTSITQAITFLTKTSPPHHTNHTHTIDTHPNINNLTIPTVLRTYIQIAGYKSLCSDALTAFEHALDKEKEPCGHSTSSTSTSTSLSLNLNDRDWELILVKRLREEYWLDKLGGKKGHETVCACEACGRVRLTSRKEVMRHGARTVDSEGGGADHDASEASGAISRKKLGERRTGTRKGRVSKSKRKIV